MFDPDFSIGKRSPLTKNIKKEYSPHDDEMEDIDEQGEEAEIIDVDESDSVMINQERLRQDLINYNGGESYNIDPENRITRFILFKIADFCVHHFEYWRKYVFEETDNGRAELLAKGIRHDITGEDHPVLRVRLGGVFALERGLPVTVDDDTLRDFYQDRARMPGATLDAEERVRRYKFSVMVTKLIEALYRRGYDLGGEFRMRVHSWVMFDPDFSIGKRSPLTKNTVWRVCLELISMFSSHLQQVEVAIPWSSIPSVGIGVNWTPFTHTLLKKRPCLGVLRQTSLWGLVPKPWNQDPY